MPEVIVVMAYGQILARSVLEIPRIACFEPARIPPPHIAVRRPSSGDRCGRRRDWKSPSSTWMKVSTPGTFSCKPTRHFANETGGSLHDRLAQLAPATLVSALAQLATGQAPRQPQDSASRLTLPSSRAPTENRLVATRGDRAKNPAFDPWPGASPRLVHHSKIKISVLLVAKYGEPEAVTNEKKCSLPPRGVRLEEVQLEGGAV